MAEINWHRLGKLVLVGIATFAAIAVAAVVLGFISLPWWLLYNGVMFAVTGAVLAVVVWAAREG